MLTGRHGKETYTMGCYVQLVFMGSLQNLQNNSPSQKWMKTYSIVPGVLYTW